MCGLYVFLWIKKKLLILWNSLMNHDKFECWVHEIFVLWKMTGNRSMPQLIHGSCVVLENIICDVEMSKYGFLRMGVVDDCHVMFFDLQVFLLCLLAGLSITWFNTVCFVLCIKNFPSNRPLALSLTISFNGVSAALYNLAANSLNPSSSALYLLLNAIIPLITSFAALIPILRQPPLDPLSPDGIKRDQLIFVVLNFLAVITGIYLLFVHSSDKITARFLLLGAIFLLVLPLGIPGVTYARKWFRDTIYSNFELKHSGFILVDADDLELHKELLSREGSLANGLSYSTDGNESTNQTISWQRSSASDEGCVENVIGKDQLFMLGEEHNAQKLLKRLDFWFYYLAYFCGGTIGLVYSNNLGQIAQSLGHTSMTSKLITFYSSFSFFGRLLSAAPDFIRL